MALNVISGGPSEQPPAQPQAPGRGSAALPAVERQASTVHALAAAAPAAATAAPKEDSTASGAPAAAAAAVQQPPAADNRVITLSDDDSDAEDGSSEEEEEEVDEELWAHLQPQGWANARITGVPFAILHAAPISSPSQ